MHGYSFPDCRSKATKYLNKPQRRKHSPIETSDVVESLDISSDDDNDSARTENNNPQIDGSPHALIQLLKIKQEKIETLEHTVKVLGNRIGTEIIADDDDNAGCPTLKRPLSKDTVNTRNYQIDGEFGKSIYYITNVRQLIFFLLFRIVRIINRHDFSVHRQSFILQ